MADCKDASVPLCVASNPSLGLAGLKNLFGAIVGIWFLVTSYQGILRMSGSKGFIDFVSAFYNGITSFFTTNWSKVSDASTVARAAYRDFSSNTQRTIYFLALVATVIVGYVTMEAPGYGVAIFTIAFLAGMGAIASGNFGLTLITPIAGGITAGLFITVIVWFSRFFRVSRTNQFGDTMTILIVLYALIGMMAIYGGKARPKTVSNRAEPGTGQWLTYPTVQAPQPMYIPASQAVVSYQPPPPVDLRRKENKPPAA